MHHITTAKLYTIECLLVQRLDGIVEPNADGGETHLTLKSRCQSIIESP
jgi:hypothetical protein